MDSFKFCGCCSLQAGVFALGLLTCIVGQIDIVYGAVLLSLPDLFGTSNIVQGCVSLFVGLMLLMGVIKQKPSYLFPYYLMMCINVAAYLVDGVLTIIQNLGSHYSSWLYGVWLICWAFICCYFINAVKVYRLLLIHQQLVNRGIQSPNFSVTFLGSNVVMTPMPVIESRSTTVQTVETLSPELSNFSRPESSSSRSIRPKPYSQDPPSYESVEKQDREAR